MQKMHAQPELHPARLIDGDLLADLRVKAMRPSLEAAGRFDPERARNRFLSSFEPANTERIELAGKLAGFLVVRKKADHLYLDHLYVLPDFHGLGVGTFALNSVKEQACSNRMPIRLMALNGSPANRFYLSHGFRITGQDELDTHYEWTPAG